MANFGMDILMDRVLYFIKVTTKTKNHQKNSLAISSMAIFRAKGLSHKKTKMETRKKSVAYGKVIN